MINNDFIQDVSQRISQAIPLAKSVRAEAQWRIFDILQGAFSRLNLVTREEFDAQLKVLERAEQTIAGLERQVALLESAAGLSEAGSRSSDRK